MVGILRRAICIGKLLAPNLVPRILQERGFQNNYKEPGPSFSPNYPPRAKGCTIATGGGRICEPGSSFQSVVSAGPAENRHSSGRCAMRCSVLRLRCRPNASPMRNALAICILLFAVFPIALPAQQSSSSSGANAGLANAQFRAVAWPPRRGGPDASDGSSEEWFLLVVGACRGAGKHRQRSHAANSWKSARRIRKRLRRFTRQEIRRRRKSPAQSGQLYPRYAEAMVLLGQLMAAHNRARKPSAYVLRLPGWIRILFQPTSVWRTFRAN